MSNFNNQRFSRLDILRVDNLLNLRHKTILLMIGSISHHTWSRDLIPVYRAKYFEIGPIEAPITADYIVIEGVDPDDYVNLHYPEASPDEHTRRVADLHKRVPTAKAILDILGQQFKKSVKKRVTQDIETYTADIDARIALAKQGKARFAAIASMNPHFKELDIYAMVGIFPDFGGGPPLQIIEGRPVVFDSKPPQFELRKERVRIVGSAQSFYLDDSKELTLAAGSTPLVWGDRMAVAFFSVPKTLVQTSGYFWPNAVNDHAAIDWKTYLLNLVVADGLLRFGEHPLTKQAPPTIWNESETQDRQNLFNGIGREPYVRAESLGLASQTRAGVSEIQLFTYSETLAELFFPKLGFVRVEPRDDQAKIGNLRPIWMKTTRDKLEAEGLDTLRADLAALDPNLLKIRMSRAPFSEGAFGNRVQTELFVRLCAESLSK